MEKLIRCEQGLHTYDSSKHSVCPHCKSAVFEFTGVNNMSKPTVKVDNKKKEGPADNKTRPVQDEVSISLSDSGKTQVIRTSKGIRPVTGWLVIIDGPGKGSSFALYNGMNSIGRAKNIGEGAHIRDQEVCLDFGSGSDKEIARDTQAKLTYDQKGKLFYLKHENGSNVTYLNDTPALELKTLEAYDRISMGKTVLLFIPLCGEKFDWPVE